MSVQLSRDDGAALIEIARRAIASAFLKDPTPDFGDQCFPSHSSALTVPRGAFVSLYRSGRLRGCVGQVENPGPLAELVAHIAVRAALHDSRFTPLGADEVATLSIELSVLSPLALIKPEGAPETIPEAIASAVIAGRDGLMVVRDRSRGLLLPQVAAERRWSSERFLEETCAKAGLPRNAWRDPEVQVFTFTAEVFSDMEPQSIQTP